MIANRSYCTFRLNRLLVGIEVVYVQEVMGARPITPVPLADRAIRGLINLRGQIVLAVDLRRCLALADDGLPLASMSVVLRTPDGPVCLLVDEVLDIVDVLPSTMEAPPETLPSGLRSFTKGTYPLASGLLLALETDALVEALEAGFSPGRQGQNSTSLRFQQKA
ncbi:MAG TPA: chemotaxis protein CheW [Isosphaeraceae bacterium]|nr:chemotaxis protein CheW [Isosphaeraceae bacterium]